MGTSTPRTVHLAPPTLDEAVEAALRFGPMSAEEVVEFLDGSEPPAVVKDCLWTLVKDGRAKIRSDERYELLGRALQPRK